MVLRFDKTQRPFLTRNFTFMTEIVVLGLKLASLAKLDFFGKNLLVSEHFESPMNI